MTGHRWTEERIGGVDFETTGVRYAIDRVIQYCVADTDPRHDPMIVQGLINPGVPIPKEASDIHGITDRDVEQYGEDPRAALEGVRDLLSAFVMSQVPIGGMNLAFDLSMLRWECRRWDLKWIEVDARMPLAPVLDAFVLDKYVDPWRKGKRKLTDLARHYGVPLDESAAHDATVDTLASVEVLRAIGRRYPEVGEMSAYRLTALQVEWRAEQQVSLQKHFRQKGQVDAVVDPCWPLCLH